MEKHIKMSLETARELYINAINSKGNGDKSLIIKLIEENFTEQELEGKKSFTWWDSFDGGGYSIHGGPKVTDLAIDKRNVQVFKTEKQALSALAFAQLSHICFKYNQGKKLESSYGWSIFYYDISEKLIVLRNGYSCGHLFFYTQKDAEISMEVNRDLWNQYWML